MLMATQSKTQLLTNVYALLKRRYKPKADRNASRLSVLKAVVYGICHEDTTREQANQALSRFNDEFFDWNEIRVSSLDEIQESLAGIPDPELKAQRIRRFLRQLFNRTYGFTLDALDQEAAQGSPQGPPDLRRFLIRLCHGHRHPAGARRPRDPDRQGLAPRLDAAGNLRIRAPGPASGPGTRRPQEPRRRVPRPDRRPRQ